MIKSQKVIFYLSILWLFAILLMGGWWLYLMNYLGQQLSSQGIAIPDIIRLTKWEGGTFFVLILLVTSTMYYYYFRMIHKNQAMQAFFSSLTHELKTPLASIRLQGEVIREVAEDLENSSLSKLCDRLTEDTNSLEMQMDKVLQLSQVEKGIQLNIQEVNLSKLLSSKLTKKDTDLTLKLNDETDLNQTAMIDAFAFDLIVRNLLENTKRHSANSSATFTLRNKNTNIELQYTDGGEFKGDAETIGDLFSKGTQSKGSGIGLYLIRKLTEAMQGQCQFHTSTPFTIVLTFKKSDTL